MNLQQLTTFCTVISEGSMTAAAEKLYLTQPAVSQQIRSLEEEMKVALLVRGVRQVRPTMQGQLLYDYAKRILHLTQQAEVAIQTMSQELSGSIRVGTINSIGLYMISPIIGMLLRHNTGLRVKQVYGSYEKIISDLQNNHLDLVILPDVKSQFDLDFNQFENKFLMTDEMWLVGSGKDTSLPPMVELKNVTAKPVILFSESYPQFKRQFETKLNGSGVQLEPVFESDNVGTIKKVIESGLGWGYLPSHCIRKQVRARRLTHVQTEDLKFSVNLYMYFQPKEQVRQVAEVFYRALQQQAVTK